MKLKRIRMSKGFSLVELLVVMVIMGLVMTAVYGLFINNKRTSATSEEVVDVQQNLRVAMETLVSDIRMAGYLIPDGALPITSMPNTIGIDTDDPPNNDVIDDGGEFFILQTSSSAKTYARVVSDGADIVVEDGMAELFRSDEFIRVIRPTSLTDVTGEWKIGTPDPDTNELPVSIGYVAGLIEPGDMVVRKLANETMPSEIRYWLRPTSDAGNNNFELMRGYTVNDGTLPDPDLEVDVIARNINTLQLTYLAPDGTAATAVDDISAIRINLSAQTDNTKTGAAGFSGTKTRSLQTVVKIRNASGV